MTGRRMDRFVRACSVAGIDPVGMAHALKGAPRFVRDWRAYDRLAKEFDVATFPLDPRRLYPDLEDWHEQAGTASGHYFRQDLWAAREIHARQLAEHLDVGSAVDGSILVGTANESIASVSSLHAVDHSGLGRHGDVVDPSALFRGMQTLRRVLTPGRRLYFSVPVRRERLHFNAHRVFAPDTVLSTFEGLERLSFAAVDDAGGLPRTSSLAMRSCSTSSPTCSGSASQIVRRPEAHASPRREARGR